MVFYKLGSNASQCGDTLSLASTCTGIKPVKLTACQPAPPPPNIGKCNVTIEVRRSKTSIYRQDILTE